MVDLKRFFKLGLGSKVKCILLLVVLVWFGIKMLKGGQILFDNDYGFIFKYGKFGKVLGVGVGGFVWLMKCVEDSIVFVVKEFRFCYLYEMEREYVKKLMVEYCMGFFLYYGNIIEMFDIVQEKGKWYEVMEYVLFDLFVIVMMGKMVREEVICCFLQILSGVMYFYSMGLVYWDLKFDNVVVSEWGIMKIIDFGSVYVFKYFFEMSIVFVFGEFFFFFGDGVVMWQFIDWLMYRYCWFRFIFCV